MQTNKQQQARSGAVTGIFYTTAAIAGAVSGVMALPATSTLVMVGTGVGLFLFTIGLCALFSGLWTMVVRK